MAYNLPLNELVHDMYERSGNAWAILMNLSNNFDCVLYVIPLSKLRFYDVDGAHVKVSEP